MQPTGRAGLHCTGEYSRRRGDRSPVHGCGLAVMCAMHCMALLHTWALGLRCMAGMQAGPQHVPTYTC